MVDVIQRPKVPLQHYKEDEHRRMLASAVNDTMPTVSSWTPELRFGGNTTGITYASRSGQSILWGANVYETWFKIVLTSKGTATGAATIAGLEKANGMVITAVSADLSLNNLSGAGSLSDVRIRVEPDTSIIVLSYGQGGSIGDGTAFTDGEFTSATEVVGRISYRL